MSDLSALVSEDSRTPIQKLRRCALWQVADEAGIQYPPSAAKTVMIALLEGAGIDVTQSKAVQWAGVSVQDEKGGSHIETYPVVPEHATARKDIDYDAAIEEKAKEKAPPILPLDAMLPWQLQRLCKERGIATVIDGVKLKKDALIAALEG